MPCRDHKKPGISQAFCGPKGPIIPLHPQGTGESFPPTRCALPFLSPAVPNDTACSFTTILTSPRRQREHRHIVLANGFAAVSPFLVPRRRRQHLHIVLANGFAAKLWVLPMDAKTVHQCQKPAIMQRLKQLFFHREHPAFVIRVIVQPLIDAQSTTPPCRFFERVGPKTSSTGPTLPCR